MNRILVIDANAPWVRSLLGAMKGKAQVYALNVHVTAWFGRFSRWHQGDDGVWEKQVFVPGWTKFPKISAAIVRRLAKAAIRRMGGVDFIVYTLPWYAGVAESFRNKTFQVYHAHDPFRFYDWDPKRTMDFEKRMLDACNAVSAIARALAEDFRKITATPVFDCPNAVSSEFLEKLAAHPSRVPEDLNELKRPIIGCVGQMNRSYDWPMIGTMADAMPEATFVFIGPIFEESPELRKPMESAMSRPNVKWLGKKPHEQLPGYLQAFDVCLNPLAKSEHSDRRSPLRLYDYLATDRPILSIAVSEALTHGNLISTFTTADEGIALLRRMTRSDSDYKIDMEARRAYIRKNTWEARAEEFLRQLELLKRKDGGA